jgi:hypothetical protein
MSEQWELERRKNMVIPFVEESAFLPHTWTLMSLNT